LCEALQKDLDYTRKRVRVIAGCMAPRCAVSTRHGALPFALRLCASEALRVARAPPPPALRALRLLLLLAQTFDLPAVHSQACRLTPAERSSAP
jgi:hypothetical protein